MNTNMNKSPDTSPDASLNTSARYFAACPILPMLPALLVILIFAVSVQAKIRIAASIPDLASIAASVGGAEVETFSIAKAGGNPHFVEVLPSHMIRVVRARLYVKAGLGLDPWADAILEGSRNNAVTVVDASAGVPVLEKPAGKVDASRGDVHPQGNPHYWLDPANGIRVAETIRDALQAADPAHAPLYEENAAKFRADAETRIREWKTRMEPLAGAPIVTYHSSWVYFTQAFGLRVVAHVEPFPGIPPTARHLQELVDAIQSSGAKILLQEPYYPDKDPRFLERKTGIRAYRFTPSCRNGDAGEYLAHFDAMVAALTEGGK